MSLSRRGFFGACIAAAAAPQCELPVSAQKGARFVGCKIELILRDEIDGWVEQHRYKEGEPISLARPRNMVMVSTPISKGVRNGLRWT